MKDAATRLAIDEAALADLIAANHILYNQGVLDGFGHISLRHPGHPDSFLIARSMAPALVTPRDIMWIGLDGVPREADAPRPYLERFVHAEIYRARPDVTSVVHCHSPAVLPFTVSKVPLRPVYHMAGFLVPDVPVFEIRDSFGPATDTLVRNAEQAVALAQCLGDRTAVLMRGHGATIVGSTLRQAVFRAVYTDANARVQLAAMQLGEPTYLTTAEGLAAARTNDGQIDRDWALWRQRLSDASA